ncbi:hypothetical protein [Acinetobacter seifertii]|uniref:hypothetical protein n=1 Tax=Acinetobacter seifertii TaxID=1530123 RepID=UPI0032130EBD
MGDKVEQTADAKNGSTINQAGHDIHNHYGPKMHEIIETIDYQVSRQFESLLHKHAPVLIQNEMLKVEACVKNFKETISSKLTEQFEILKTSLNEDLAGEKLIKGVTDSNFQFLFQDCLEQVIRKKEQAPEDILVALLVKKIETEDNTDYLIEEAIEVLKYLNKNQVNFILLIDIIIYELSFRLNADVSDVNLDLFKTTTLFQIKWILHYFLKQNPLTLDFEYLNYKGMFLDNKVYTSFSSIPEAIIKHCVPEKLILELNTTNEEILEILLPELKLILDKFGLPSPYNFKVLSSIANVIADKNRNCLIISIEKYKALNDSERQAWSKSIFMILQQKGIASIY